MSEFISNVLNNCQNYIKHLTSIAIGNGLIAIGMHIEEVAVIIIVIGALLWICKNTKVFRWGCISYGIGLLIEIIGSAII